MRLLANAAALGAMPWRSTAYTHGRMLLPNAATLGHMPLNAVPW
jgi:hypothetical protein